MKTGESIIKSIKPGGIYLAYPSPMSKFYASAVYRFEYFEMSLEEPFNRIYQYRFKRKET